MNRMVKATDWCDCDLKNQLLLSYIHNRLNNYGAVDKLKIQKSLYYIQKNSMVDGIETVKYRFHKWDHGPMSFRVYDDTEALEAVNVIKTRVGSNIIFKSDRSDIFYNTINQLLSEEENQPIKDYIDYYIRAIGSITGKQLREISHRQKVVYRGKEITMEEIPKGVMVLDRPDEKNFDVHFIISDKWLRTINILMNYNFEEIVETIRQPFTPEMALSRSDVFGSN